MERLATCINTRACVTPTHVHTCTCGSASTLNPFTFQVFAPQHSTQHEQHNSKHTEGMGGKFNLTALSKLRQSALYWQQHTHFLQKTADIFKKSVNSVFTTISSFCHNLRKSSRRDYHRKIRCCDTHKGKVTSPHAPYRHSTPTKWFGQGFTPLLIWFTFLLRF